MGCTSISDVQGNTRQEVLRCPQIDHSWRPMAHLNLGDMVRIKKGTWATKAKVLKSAGRPRSYAVVTENGTVLRHNRQHLLITREPFQRNDQEYDDDDFEVQFRRSSAIAHRLAEWKSSVYARTAHCPNKCRVLDSPKKVAQATSSSSTSGL
ncbi:hypothetical protein MRX96_009617 [Rhipicephalus microplus]